MNGELSDCCGEHVIIVGGAGCNYYTCDGCNRPCGTDEDGEQERRKQKRKLKTDCIHAIVCEFANQDEQCPCQHYLKAAKTEAKP